MRQWLAKVSEGKGQYVAGGAVWTLAVVGMLAFGYGGCFAHGAEQGAAPGAVAEARLGVTAGAVTEAKPGVTAGAVTAEDFSMLMPPGVVPFTIPAAAPAATVRLELVSPAASASAVPVDAALDAPAGPLWQAWATEAIWASIAALLAWAVKTYAAWLNAKKARDEEIAVQWRIGQLALAVAESGYQATGGVRDLKRNSPGGKLTDAQRKRVMSDAVIAMRDNALTWGLPMVKELSDQYLQSMLEWAVRKIKGEAEAAKVKLPLAGGLPSGGSSTGSPAPSTAG